MNRYELPGYPLFFIVSLEIFLGLILLRQNPGKSPVNRAVAVFAFASAGYSLCTGIIYIRTSLGLPIDIIARGVRLIIRDNGAGAVDARSGGRGFPM